MGIELNYNFFALQKYRYLMNYHACSFIFFIVNICYFKDNIYICMKYYFEVAFNETFQHIRIRPAHPLLYDKG